MFESKTLLYSNRIAAYYNRVVFQKKVTGECTTVSASIPIEIEIDAHQFTPSASTQAKRYSLTLSISCRHPATHCTYWELWVKRTTHHFLPEESGSKCWSILSQIRLHWHKSRRVRNIKEVLCKYHFTLSEHLNMPSFSIYEWKLSSVWIYLPEHVFLSSY